MPSWIHMCLRKSDEALRNTRWQYGQTGTLRPVQQSLTNLLLHTTIINYRKLHNTTTTEQF